LQHPSSQNLQHVRELTNELYALTVEMSGFAQQVRSDQRDGLPISPGAAVTANAMLGKIARGATQLRDEAYRLSLEPETGAERVAPGRPRRVQPALHRSR
jgi:hypothetical protein